MEILISRLLLVTEDKQIIEDLLEHFEQNGYETEIALNIKTAINVLNERNIGLIFIGLKGQKSINTVINIIEKISETNSSIPIIVIGGEKSKRTENKFIKAGASKLYPNPVEKDELLKIVRNLLKH